MAKMWCYPRVPASAVLLLPHPDSFLTKGISDQQELLSPKKHNPRGQLERISISGPLWLLLKNLRVHSPPPPLLCPTGANHQKPPKSWERPAAALASFKTKQNKRNAFSSFIQRGNLAQHFERSYWTDKPTCIFLTARSKLVQIRVTIKIMTVSVEC